jgi:hypothetical protein
MADHTQSPPMTQKNHPPKERQKSVYRDDNGDLYDCFIHQVDIPGPNGEPGHSPDGKYYAVSVTVMYPGRWPSPGRADRCGHVYWVDLGLVTDDPCPPPWPG